MSETDHGQLYKPRPCAKCDDLTRRLKEAERERRRLNVLASNRGKYMDDLGAKCVDLTRRLAETEAMHKAQLIDAGNEAKDRDAGFDALLRLLDVECLPGDLSYERKIELLKRVSKGVMAECDNLTRRLGAVGADLHQTLERANKAEAKLTDVERLYGELIKALQEITGSRNEENPGLGVTAATQLLKNDLADAERRLEEVCELRAELVDTEQRLAEAEQWTEQAPPDDEAWNELRRKLTNAERELKEGAAHNSELLAAVAGAERRAEDARQDAREYETRVFEQAMENQKKSKARIAELEAKLAAAERRAEEATRLAGEDTLEFQSVIDKLERERDGLKEDLTAERSGRGYHEEQCQARIAELEREREGSQEILAVYRHDLKVAHDDRDAAQARVTELEAKNAELEEQRDTFKANAKELFVGVQRRELANAELRAALEAIRDGSAHKGLVLQGGAWKDGPHDADSCQCCIAERALKSDNSGLNCPHFGDTKKGYSVDVGGYLIGLCSDCQRALETQVGNAQCDRKDHWKATGFRAALKKRAGRELEASQAIDQETQLSQARRYAHDVLQEVISEADIEQPEPDPSTPGAGCGACAECAARREPQGRATSDSDPERCTAGLSLSTVAVVELWALGIRGARSGAMPSEHCPVCPGASAEHHMKPWEQDGTRHCGYCDGPMEGCCGIKKRKERGDAE